MSKRKGGPSPDHYSFADHAGADTDAPTGAGAKRQATADRATAWSGLESMGNSKPVKTAGALKPKLPGANTDHATAHLAPSCVSDARQSIPGGKQTAAKDTRILPTSSRKFDEGEKPGMVEQKDQQRLQWQQQQQQKNDRDFSPTAEAQGRPLTASLRAAINKLNRPARSTSYTNPLPLLGDESKLNAGTAAATQTPLTEQNLRSLRRSFERSSASASASGGRRPTTATAEPAGRVSVTDPAPPTSATTGPKPSSSMRKSKSPRKHDKGKDKKKTKSDPDTHPLNLPPDQLRKLTLQMARQEAEAEAYANNESASAEKDVPETNNNEFTLPQGTSPPANSSKNAPEPSPEAAGEGTTNGVNGHDERSPTPPPHRTPPPPKVDPEACKAAGNKFFKAKDYERAIEEYSKGKSPIGVLLQT